MKVLRWIASRKWGQIVCFAWGIWLLVDALIDADADPDKRMIMVGAVLMATGLALKAIDAFRQCNSR